MSSPQDDGTARRAIGLLGGTFDPVHHGHLRLAVELYQSLELHQVRLIPAGQPAHRADTIASAEQRYLMCRAAVQGEPGLVVDDCEVVRMGASYAFDTLQHLRAQFASDALIWLMGSDVFCTLWQWHRSQELLELAHVVVVQRPGERLSDSDLKPWRTRLVATKEALQTKSHGGILLYEMPMLDISSTRIRQSLATGESVRYLLPDSVWSLIHEWKLYGREMGPVN